MSRITDELNRIKGAKASLKVSIENKGVAVDTAATLDKYSGYVDAIQTGSTTKVQALKTTSYDVTSTEVETFTFSKDEGYDAMLQAHVTITPQTEERSIDITANGTQDVVVNAGKCGMSKVIVNTNVPYQKPEQAKTLSATTNGSYEITPDEGYVISKATVEVNVDTTEAYNEGAAAQKAKLITTAVTENGTYATEDGYSSIVVNVPSGASALLQEKTYTANGTYTPDAGYDGIGKVTINVPTTYSAETITVNFTNSGGNLDDLKGKAYVEVNSNQHVYNGSAVTISVMPGKTYTISFGSVDKYMKPADVMRTTLWGGRYKITGSYIYLGESMVTTDTIYYGMSEATTGRQFIITGANVKSSGYTDIGYITLEASADTITITSGGTTGKTFCVFPEFDESKTIIFKATFDICSGLTSADLSHIKGEVQIGNLAFGLCESLTSIELPPNLTSIGNSVFYHCTSLTSIELPSGVTSIGDSVFYDCESLTSIELPPNLTLIGDSVFYDCESLTSIEIPSGVTAIRGYAFYGCTSLTSIELPPNLTLIGDSVFDGCTSLSSVTLTSVTPPTIGTDVFTNAPVTIYVPAEAVDAYKAAWTGYASLIQPIS